MSSIPPPDVRSPLNYIPNTQGATKRVFLNHDPGEREAAIYEIGTEAMNSMTGFWFKLGTAGKKRTWHTASSGPTPPNEIKTNPWLPVIQTLPTTGSPHLISGTQTASGYYKLLDENFMIATFYLAVTGRQANDPPGRINIILPHTLVPYTDNPARFYSLGRAYVENIPWKKQTASSAADLDDTYVPVFMVDGIGPRSHKNALSVRFIKEYPDSSLATSLPDPPYLLGHDPQRSNAAYQNFRISGTFAAYLE